MHVLDAPANLSTRFLSFRVNPVLFYSFPLILCSLPTRRLKFVSILPFSAIRCRPCYFQVCLAMLRPRAIIIIRLQRQLVLTLRLKSPSKRSSESTASTVCRPFTIDLGL